MRAKGFADGAAPEIGVGVAVVTIVVAEPPPPIPRNGLAMRPKVRAFEVFCATTRQLGH
jgi:hypothetical protein